MAPKKQLKRKCEKKASYSKKKSNLGKKKPKLGKKTRQNFSVATKAVLERWLWNHVDHPKPTEMMKKKLVVEANITLKQLNQWFVNARRRTLQKFKDIKVQLAMERKACRRKQKIPRRIQPGSQATIAKEEFENVLELCWFS